MKMEVQPWPPSVWLAFICLILIGFVLLCLTYVLARDSYESVGYNNGGIDQRYETMTRLREFGLVRTPCPPGIGRTELIALKAHSIYVIHIDGQPTLCE